MTVRAQGTCPTCETPDQLLYNLEPTDPSEGLACPECIRRRAPHVNRTTPCDKCGKPGAWRNPYTRRNEYLCGNHHAESGEGVVLNKWAPRASTPLNAAARPQCFVKSNGCRGEVKPRSVNGVSRTLCTKHAGKTSAAWVVEDGEV